MGLEVTTLPTLEPVTLAEACAHCKGTMGDDDGVLNACIAAARAKAEGLMLRPIMTRTYRQSLDAFPAEEIALAVPSVRSVSSVQYTDTAGNPQALASDLYVLDGTTAIQPWLLPSIGTAWPETESSINSVRITFVAGLAATAEEVPADVKAWILLTVGFLYGQREAFDMTGKVAAIPNRWVDSLLDPHRVYGF